ncbi:MAG TPA: DegQ family serine endoprotease [Usitatibacter sp.]|jgi:serine protease Do|nr:DegQ family serine endoprotease [Usitatibacter sp.]
MNRLQASFLGAVLALGLAAQAQAQNQPQGPKQNMPDKGGATAQVLPDFADLVEKYGPAVVNINTQTRAPRQGVPGLSEDDPFFEFFRRFMPPDQQPQQPPGGGNGRGRRGEPAPNTPRGPLRPFGLGSGFIVSQDGYIVTNAHVVENAEEITVRLSDKREFKAKLIGADTRSDVAVVKVEATGLPMMKIGDTSRLRVGEWVIAIGSPFGFANTVTAGIVSAKSRENLSGDPNLDAVPFIQTDVAVNPGNSGGPLLNMRGEVVGINSQIFSRTGAFAGISFAIPIDYAYNVADQLIKTGHVTRGRIGVGIQNVSKDLADSLGLAKAQGAAVSNVEENSPAAKAGLEVGDVITKIDGHPVEGSADLSRTIRAMKPGTKANLSVWRSGKMRDVTITVAEFKDDEQVKTAAGEGKKKEQPKPGKLGLAVAELSADQKKALKVTSGVVVEAADGAVLAAGVGPGDVILRVNNVDTPNVKAFNDAVAKLDPKKPVALLIKDEQGTRYITFRPEGD